MYAIPGFLLLVTLIALVYLPKIRRPVLWTAVSLLGLGILGSGVWWALRVHQERDATEVRGREVSYIVDHAIRPPAHCKPPNEFLVPAKLTEREEAFSADARAAGYPEDGIGETIRQRRAARLARSKAESPDSESKAKSNSDDHDPDAHLCKSELEALTIFIKKHKSDLNEFIKERQNDQRVGAVQAVLGVRGIQYAKTCKNLLDEKKDDYELHQQGCK